MFCIIYKKKSFRIHFNNKLLFYDVFYSTAICITGKDNVINIVKVTVLILKLKK